MNRLFELEQQLQLAQEEAMVLINKLDINIHKRNIIDKLRAVNKIITQIKAEIAIVEYESKRTN